MIARFPRLAWLTAAALCLNAPLAAAALTWTVEQRLSCQQTLADLDWQRRVWPDSNGRAKPPRSAVVTDAELRHRVDDRLRMQTALQSLYGVELDAAALQSELNRMAANSRDPAALARIYAALADSPTAVGECLARPELAQQRLQEAYAYDPRWQGEVRLRAQAWIDDGQPSSRLASSGAQEFTVRFAREGSPVAVRPGQLGGNAPTLRVLDAEAWAGKTRHQPIGLTEHPRHFELETVLAKSTDWIDTRVVVWNKQPFDHWWRAQRQRWTAANPVVQALQPPTAERTANIHYPADSWWVPEMPRARYGHLAFWTGTEMIVWGGHNPEMDTGSRYRPDTDSWTALPVAGAPTGSRAFCVGAWSGTEVLVFCAGDRSAARFSPASDSWRPIPFVNEPLASYGSAAAWTGAEFVVWGGQQIGGAVVSSGARYDPALNRWRLLPSSGAPAARTQASTVWTGNKVLIWGGIVGSSPVATGASYDPVSNTWQPMDNANAPTASYDHEAVWTGSEMLLWGGTAASSGHYDPLTGQWQPMAAPTVPVAIDQDEALWTGSELILWGGRNQNGSPVPLGVAYDPATRQWRALRQDGAPRGRVVHTLVWTGAEMLVWGGWNGLQGVVYSDGGRYHPGMDRWIGINNDQLHAPTSSDYAAAWTGAELLVWGHDARGSAFDVTTARWRPLATAGAPSARAEHEAVWTGTDMLVWGGLSAGQHPNDGGHYNPATDTWTAMGTTGAPAGRSYHTATWAENEMIVWGGGTVSGTPYNNGGRYNPQSRTWLPMPPGDPARAGSTAVWTGTELLVFGSSGGGQRYNRASNSWSPMNNAATPQPRYWHSAVWTGEEMIIWGGAVPNSLGDGGRYRPATDSWQLLPFNFPGPPNEREQHNAVWTGADMLVYGGNRHSSLAEVGDRYHAASNTWSTMSRLRAPGGGYNYQTFWTGEAMLAFKPYQAGAPAFYYPYAFTVDAVFGDGFED